MMDEYMQVITTCDQKEAAQMIARTLLEKRLAGCVQVLGPLGSMYWWQGSLETAEEWLCLIKSKSTLYAEIEKTIKKIHPYALPEIIALPIFKGSKDYLAWLAGELEQKI